MNDKIKLHTLPDWDKPQNGYRKIYVDHWWMVDAEGNPLFYSEHYNAPQCNMNEQIVLHLYALSKSDDAKGVKQIPVVYVPISLRHDF
jgi:hypothetical protein